jgi:hypothetical protein
MDIGFMLVVPWYMGDLAPTIPQTSFFPPAIGPIVRYNFNMRNSLRAHMVFYELAGSGEIFGGTAAEFQSSFVDLGLDFEFNWWPYKTDHAKTKYSPYVSAGLGYGLNLTSEGKSHLYLPMGIGLKANLWRKLSGGVEVSMRKTFTDKIDGVYNPGGEEVQTPLGNTDWYMFTGIFLTYKIFSYNEECPTYNEKTYNTNASGTSNKKGRWFTRKQDNPGTSKSRGSTKSSRTTKSKRRNR